AIFDFQIHDGLHRRVPRIADDAASAESPRPEFHASAKPANDLAVRQIVRYALIKFVIIESDIGRALRFQKAWDFVIGECRTQEAASHRILAAVCIPRFSEHLMPGAQRGAYSAPRIAGCRLNPYPFKRTFF